MAQRRLTKTFSRSSEVDPQEAAELLDTKTNKGVFCFLEAQEAANSSQKHVLPALPLPICCIKFIFILYILHYLIRGYLGSFNAEIEIVLGK